MIFVTVGSQKFQFNRLLIKIDDLIARKRIDKNVFAQIGVSDYKPKNFKYVDFVTQDEFNARMDEADIIITHAGTGVIVNAIKKGKKVVALPRLSKFKEHVDDHQIQLLKEFDELGFIEVVYDIKDLEKAIYMCQEKKYDKYVSNTDTIIENIEKFLEV